MSGESRHQKGGSRDIRLIRDLQGVKGREERRGGGGVKVVIERRSWESKMQCREVTAKEGPRVAVQMT